MCNQYKQTLVSSPMNMESAPLNFLPMSGVEEVIQVKADSTANKIEINYAPRTKRTLFDICDVNGRILKTGAITGKSTHVDSADLCAEDYIVLILDGDRVHSCKFRIGA